MGQPIKNGFKATKKKQQRKNVRPPVNSERSGEVAKVKKKIVVQQKKPKPHPEYGTSKLEERFEKNILGILGVRYIYQYKMESIGRYLDFVITGFSNSKNSIRESIGTSTSKALVNPQALLAIEIDGEYWHSHGLVYEQMTPTQKKNRRVDKEKDHWCAINCIKLIRIWENDINKHPEKVIAMLKKELGIARIEAEKKEDKNKRH